MGVKWHPGRARRPLTHGQGPAGRSRPVRRGDDDGWVPRHERAADQRHPRRIGNNSFDTAPMGCSTRRTARSISRWRTTGCSNGSAATCWAGLTSTPRRRSRPTPTATRTATISLRRSTRSSARQRGTTGWRNAPAGSRRRGAHAGRCLRLAGDGGARTGEEDPACCRGRGAQYRLAPPSSRNARRPRPGSPTLGQHTAIVLKEFGYSDAELAELSSQGAFGRIAKKDND